MNHPISFLLPFFFYLFLEKKAIESNHQLYQPSQKPKQREVFFKELKKGYGFKKAVKRCYPKKYLKNIVREKIQTYILPLTGLIC